MFPWIQGERRECIKSETGYTMNWLFIIPCKNAAGRIVARSYDFEVFTFASPLVCASGFCRLILYAGKKEKQRTWGKLIFLTCLQAVCYWRVITHGFARPHGININQQGGLKHPFHLEFTWERGPLKFNFSLGNINTFSRFQPTLPCQSSGWHF